MIFFTRFTVFNWMNLCIFQHCHVLSLCLPGVLSVLGNGTLLFVVYRKKSSLKPAEFFVVNLAISDLGMSITLFPLAIPSAFAHMWVNVKFSIAISPFAYRLSLCHLLIHYTPEKQKIKGKSNKWWNRTLTWGHRGYVLILSEHLRVLTTWAGAHVIDTAHTNADF